MRGLSQGEASSATNPVVQLFVRSGEVMADFYAGTYRIDDVHDPCAGASAKVSVTAFTANEKLSTGRYVIPTGNTSDWELGTYRAVCQYQMEAGGETYTQVIEFEVLRNTDWAVGNLYLGYASTARLIQGDYGLSDRQPCELHRHIDRVSRQIEHWTHRFFEPRYMGIRLDGADGPILHLNEAIVALDKVQAIWKNSAGEEETYDYEAYLFTVYNRHLDGLLSPDDRNNPKVVRRDKASWPANYQGVKVVGVFGYSDATQSNADDRYNIGKQPDDLVLVIGSLVTRQVQDPTLNDLSVQQPGLIKSMRTRHQSVTFGSRGAVGSSSTGYDSMAGDPLLDQILMRYGPPVHVRYADRRLALEYDEENLR